MAEDCNDTITITYLPPDAKEYLISYRNEAIASKVLESRIDKQQLELPLQEFEKNNTIEHMENDQNANEKVHLVLSSSLSHKKNAEFMSAVVYRLM